MKKHLLLCFAIGAFASSFGQTSITSGKVTYEQIIKLDIKLSGEASQLESILPKERKSNKELLFCEAASLYKNEESLNDEEVIKETSGTGSITIKMKESDDLIYTDISNQSTIEQREFLNRLFLVESDKNTAKWKITGNSKTILDINCIEAELVDTSKNLKAWFAPTIAVSSGPNGLMGLPGLILAVDIDNGKTTIIAKGIDSTPISAKELSKPKKGKKVSKDEFAQIVKEKNEERANSTGTSIVIMAQ